jgi:surface antigen
MPHPRWLMAPGLLAIALAAAASNLNFMKDSPFTHFNEQDQKLFKQMLVETLEQGAVGEVRRWSNPKTTAAGEMSVLKTFERGALPCRTVSISNVAKGRTSSGSYSLCKQATGKWVQAN